MENEESLNKWLLAPGLYRRIKLLKKATRGGGIRGVSLPITLGSESDWQDRQHSFNRLLVLMHTVLEANRMVIAGKEESLVIPSLANNRARHAEDTKMASIILNLSPGISIPMPKASPEFAHLH